jgi:hypothetical protein
MLPALGALLGAGLPWSLLELVYLSDEGGWDAPGPITAVIWLLWVASALPGALIPGPSYLAIAVASAFWAAVFSWAIRTWQTRQDRRPRIASMHRKTCFSDDLQHIGEAHVRVDPVGLAGRNDRVEHGKVLASFAVADGHEILTPKSHDAQGVSPQLLSIEVRAS